MKYIIVIKVFVFCFLLVITFQQAVNDKKKVRVEILKLCIISFIFFVRLFLLLFIIKIQSVENILLGDNLFENSYTVML